MSSQDTMSYAASEEESAKSLQSEIDAAKAKITALQTDINRENQIISSLQTKQQLHAKQAERLRQQAKQEQEQEQAQAQQERQQEDKQGLMGKAADEAFPHGLF